MIIRNDASDLLCFAFQAGTPMTGDRRTSNASVHLTLSRFLSFTGAIADTHII